MKIAIIGATGYGGSELMRLLYNHPEVSIHSIHSSSQHGSSITESYPHTDQAIALNLQAIEIEKMAKEVELVFTSTPNGISSTLVPKLLEAGMKVIDLSGDFRIKDRQTYEQWYGLKAAEEKWIKEAVYGLSEWIETDVTTANLVANPGCFSTVTLLGLAPLVKEGIVDGSSIVVDAKTGVSGAGRGVSPVTHFSETNENFKIYRVNNHQHIPEIEQQLASWNEQAGPITFSPHLVPMTRGIMATMYMTATEEVSAKKLIDLYRSHYKNDPFIRVREPEVFPSTKEVYGSNFCDLSLTYDERTNRITVVAVIDNLVKGASGQAIQNMNKMLGFDEKAGLDFIPVYP